MNVRPVSSDTKALANFPLDGLIMLVDSSLNQCCPIAGDNYYQRKFRDTGQIFQIREITCQVSVKCVITFSLKMYAVVKVVKYVCAVEGIPKAFHFDT